MTKHTCEPVMSIILATRNCYETIRKTIKHLHTQSVRQLLQIVIIIPSAGALHLNESDLQCFCGFRVVEIGLIKSIGSANAKGIRQARASLVVLAEDHAFPAPKWAEVLIAAYQYPWAVVGPVIRNPNNPRSFTAWDDLLIGHS